MTSRHDVSSFLVSCLKQINARPGSLALDLPSGAGRHADVLRKHEVEVVAADLDKEVLKLAGRAVPDAMRVVLDARRSLPFRENCFDLVVVIYPVAHDFLSMLPCLIRPGGHLVFETFGAQGNNAVALPTVGEIADTMTPLCLPIRYIEKPTRKMPDRVTVKALFERTMNPYRSAGA